MIDTAVILAAGNGTRLRGVTGDMPKPLVPLAGVPILVRIMRAAQEAGVKRFVVVTGYQAERLRESIDGHPAVSAEIEWVHNPDYRTRPNGVSALTAKHSVDGPFALLMADHIFEVGMLRRLLRTPVGPRECILAVDRKVSEVFDLDDATKVRTSSGRVDAIGKDLQDYDAIDTGMFLCTPVLFDALEVATREGEGGLSDGIRWLADRGMMRVKDVGTAVWQDVDTPQMRREAEHRLSDGLCRPTGGRASRAISRRVSAPIRLALARAGITPSRVSLICLLVALAAGVCFASTSYVFLALAGLLVQLRAILDGCDDDVARLTFEQPPGSRWSGALMSSASDVAVLIGLSVGLFRRAPTAPTVWMGAAAAAAVLTGMVIAYQRSQASAKGAPRGMAGDCDEVNPAAPLTVRPCEQSLSLMRRNPFALGCFILALANQPGIVFGLWVAGAVMSLVGAIHGSCQPLRRRLAPARVAGEG